MSEKKIHPMKCPQAEVKSEWRDQELWWHINGQWVSDRALKVWCRMELDYPWSCISDDDVIRAYHTAAWASVHAPNPKEQMIQSVDRVSDTPDNVIKIESLQSHLTVANKRIEELEKILKRFADYMPKIDPDWQNAHILLGGRFTDGPIIVAGDFREASRVLKGEGE